MQEKSPASDRVGSRAFLPSPSRGRVNLAGDQTLVSDTCELRLTKQLHDWMMNAPFGELLFSVDQDHAVFASASKTDDLEAWHSAMAEMMHTIIDHEFYCHDYASKEQPHAQGLLHTLYDSMVRARRFEEQEDREGCERPPDTVF